MDQMMNQIAAFPEWLQWWLRWMQTILIVMPFLFIRHREAQMLLLAQVLNFAVGTWVYIEQGEVITKLFGLGHIFWLMVYIWIAWRWYNKKINFGFSPWFRGWLTLAMLTMTISLPLDAWDLYQYMTGINMPLQQYYSQTAN